MLLVFCYLLLGILIAAVEVRRRGSGRPVDALSFFNAAYFLFFVFVPLNVLVFGEMAVRQKYAYQTWSHGDLGTCLSLLFTYVLFVLGYSRRGNKTLVAVDRGRVALPIVPRVAGVFFLVGAVALAYHVSLVGGVAEALFLSPRVRTGEFRLDGDFLFVRQFGAFLATAFMLYWAVYLDAKLPDEAAARARTPRILHHLVIALLGSAFLYYALTTYGRREFLYPMLTCLVVWALAGRRRSRGGLIWLIGLSMLWFWIYSFVIPDASQPTDVRTVVSSSFLHDAYFRTAQGLGDSFMHFVAAEHAALWQFGFLTDLWEMPAQFLPSQVLGFERPRGMFGETSEFILGRPLEPGLSGEEPLGLHGYLLVNFAYPGMFLLFYLAGMGYRALDAAMRPTQGGSALSWLVFTWVIIGALELLREGVLVLVLKPHISWWMAIGILILFGRRHMAKTGSKPLSTIPNG